MACRLRVEQNGTISFQNGTPPRSTPCSDLNHTHDPKLNLSRSSSSPSLRAPQANRQPAQGLARLRNPTQGPRKIWPASLSCKPSSRSVPTSRDRVADFLVCVPGEPQRIQVTC